jgi:pyruvate dehydrogenase E2 component (dihydrolipoamide acetyltransferase)
MPKGRHVLAEMAVGSSQGTGAIKAMPAARALARRLNVDLGTVRPTGPDGSITAADVQRAANADSELPELQALHGVRRTMAQNMAAARSEVVLVTLTDEADIDAWPATADITIRLVRAIVAGCRAEPSLNAWYDGAAIARRVFKKVDVGIAVDTPDGLFVPVLRNVGSRDAADLRKALDRMRADVKARKIPPEELRGCTITLSNFGMIAGKHASPIVLPPTVAIIGAGRTFKRVVMTDGAPTEHRFVPLSLAFDHRAATGGEAARFLGAMIADLESAE